MAFSMLLFFCISGTPSDDKSWSNLESKIILILKWIGEKEKITGRKKKRYSL